MTYEKNLSERIIFRLTPPDRTALRNLSISDDCTLSDIIRAALMTNAKFVQSIDNLQFIIGNNDNVRSSRTWLRG